MSTAARSPSETLKGHEIVVVEAGGRILRAAATIRAPNLRSYIGQRGEKRARRITIAPVEK
jgi:hypothetical protein